MVNSLVNDAGDLVEDLADDVSGGTETPNSANETGNDGVAPEPDEIQDEVPPAEDSAEAESSIDSSPVPENETESIEETDAPAVTGSDEDESKPESSSDVASDDPAPAEAEVRTDDASEPAEAEEPADDAGAAAVDESVAQPEADASDADDEPLLDLELLDEPPTQEETDSDATGGDKALLDLGATDVVEDVLDELPVTVPDEAAEELSEPVSPDAPAAEPEPDLEATQPDPDVEASEPDPDVQAPIGTMPLDPEEGTDNDQTDPLGDLTDLLEGVERDEGAEGTRVGLGSLLGELGLGEELAEPLVEDTTGTVSDLLHDTTGVLQSDVTEELLGGTLDKVANTTDELGLPIVDDTANLLDDVVDETVVPLVDDTLGTVGEISEVVVVPLLDGTLLLVNEVTGEVVVPLLDGTVDDVGDVVDDTITPLLPFLPAPEPPEPPEPVEPIVPRPPAAETPAAEEPNDETPPADRPATRHDDSVTTATTAVETETPFNQVGPPADTGQAADRAVLTGSSATGGDAAGSAVAVSASGGGSIGGVDLAYDAPVPTPGFLIICRANAPPSLLERPRNPSVRPD